MGADLHLYTISFFIMLAFYKKPRFGFILCFLMILSGMFLQGFTAWYYNTSMTFAFTSVNIQLVDMHSCTKLTLTHRLVLYLNRKSIQEAHLLHFATVNYISSYAIGIILGYCVVNKIIVSRVCPGQ